MSTIEDLEEKLEREQNEADPHSWQDWPIGELTGDRELLDMLKLMDAKTIGEAWELSSCGEIDSQPLREAFDELWLAHPDFLRSEHPTVAALPELENRLESLERKERLLGKIQRVNAATRKLESEFLAAKNVAKEAKELWETSVLSLQRIIESARNGQQLLPGVDEDADEGTETAPGIAQDADRQKDASENPDASDEAWRAVTMESIGVKGRLLQRLVEADLTTLGDWEKRNRQQCPRKIAGVGEAAITKIEELCEAFWKREVENE